MRWLYRVPQVLYRWKLGWLFDGRLLLLIHVGRRSGKLRRTVLEVIRHDTTNDAYIVAVGFGRETNWYQNLLVNPAASVQVGRRAARVVARQLSNDAVCRELVEYGRGHPVAGRLFPWVTGIRLEDREQLRAATTFLPLVELRVVG
jgi:deazaflavin-dependent oxidoreductase (nitroreductase family)